MREKFSQSEQFIQGSHGGRKGPFRFFQKMAAAVYHPDTQGSAVGMGFKKTDTLTEAIFRNDGIRVQEENIFPGGHRQSLVAAFCKAGVFFIGDKAYTGEFRRKVFDTVIGGIVIHYNDLRGQAIHSPLHGAKALLEEVLDVEIDNDNR